MIYELPSALQQIIGLAPSDAQNRGNKIYFTSQKINDKLAHALEDNTATKDKLEDTWEKAGQPWQKQMLLVLQAKTNFH